MKGTKGAETTPFVLFLYVFAAVDLTSYADRYKHFFSP